MTKKHAYKLTPCEKHTTFNSGCNKCWIETIKHPTTPKLKPPQTLKNVNLPPITPT